MKNPAARKALYFTLLECNKKWESETTAIRHGNREKPDRLNIWQRHHSHPSAEAQVGIELVHHAHSTESKFLSLEWAAHRYRATRRGGQREVTHWKIVPRT